MDWVLDWNRIANLLVILIPFFIAVGGAFKYLLDRSDRKSQALQEAAEKRREDDEKDRDERREREMADMRTSREVFYADILREASRMRELYEAELDRGISLRTALAEAAQREMRLQQTIIELTRKVDHLQDEVAQLRKELAAKSMSL
ncbi:hypothetical protein [Aureimonas glaciei]|uniref:Uncharacterized protein n=1 Tax=Aureimonas glaciei TaxID=1776957 RepID=A0A916Y480_9HYPH|nr:hypothetical protein [Aureimonas glaciei]GGD30628.1 hypothetical protein GCM10011335_37110 [Aureimonas glaciei]